jgi:hypothetical protein
LLSVTADEPTPHRPNAQRFFIQLPEFARSTGRTRVVRPFVRAAVAVRNEAGAADEVCRDQSLRSRAACAGVAAEQAGLTLSEWVRDVLLAAPVDVGLDSAEVVLAELLALRLLFLNLQFRAHKAPLTEVVRGLIERADGVKMQRAQERLEAVRTSHR